MSAMTALHSQPIKVFLVDDHRAVLWGLERLVESAAPSMIVAGTATTRAELLARLPGIATDVVLLDLDLDGDSSLDCLEELARTTTARILILTGSSDLAAHESAVLRGARGVVHKQEPANVLLRAIEKVHCGELWLDRVALGRVMTILARGPAVDREAAKIAALTPKERQIVVTVVEQRGARNKLMAAKLNMSEHTLRNHLTTIYSKLEVDGRMHLYLYASDRRQMLAA
jgi:DNA-binding NarL/FixJ family response regulator